MEPYPTLEAKPLPAAVKPVMATVVATLVVNEGAQKSEGPIAGKIEGKIAELHPEQAVQPSHSNRTVQASVSAALAAARAETSARLASGLRFPEEDGGHSLSEMAQRDLDAALQLLADRAQYITGASGAAIALRRNGKNDMLCRASVGSSAPELGSLLSTEFGLSGESVRTRQPLRCDDAERDVRVNRDVCREMGIASVVVMPVVNDDEVLGVFELFSAKTNAFGPRDVSAVQRLSEMVETAVRLAEAAESLPQRLRMQSTSTAEAKQTETPEDQVLQGDVLEDVVLEGPIPQPQPRVEAASVKSALESVSAAKPAAPVPAKRPLFWSAALDPEADRDTAEDDDQSHVPPVLRSLRKCEACGFPVSAGRALCVECEEKKWRGQLKAPKPAPKPEGRKAPEQPVAAVAATPTASPIATSVTPSPAATESKIHAEPIALAPPVPDLSVAETSSATVAPEVSSPEFVLSVGLEPSQSWLAKNKYIVGVLLVVGVAAAGFFLLR